MSKSRKQITEMLIFLKFQENDDTFLEYTRKHAVEVAMRVA